MKFLVLLLVLALRRLDFTWPQWMLDRHRVSQLLDRWRDKVDPLGLAGVVRWLVLVALPVLVVALVLGLLHDILWGLPGFIAGGVLLLWLLGGESEFRHVDDLLVRSRMNDPERLAEGAEAHFGMAGTPEDPGYFGALLRRVLQQDARQLFATIFWLLTLGYWAALLYVLNLAMLRNDDEDRQGPAWMMHTALFWMPARLLVLCLALAGHFGRVADAVRGRILQLDNSEALLNDAAAAALDIPALDSVEAEQGPNQLEALQGMLLRCLAIWLILGALWTVLAG